MNKSHRSIWNESTGTWVAAQENAKGRGKRSRSAKTLSAAVLITLGSAVGMAHAGALDGGSTSGYAWDSAYGSGAQALDGVNNATGGATAIGSNAYANNFDGTLSNISGTVAVGGKSYAGWGGTALGGSASASATRTTAVGSGALASSNAASVLGYLATSSGAQATALGAYTTASATNSLAIGYATSATAANSVALGSGSTTTANLSAAAYNPGSSTLSGTASVANGEVSVGYAGAERRVTNVAAGSAATDAVNVSQLISEDAKVNAEGASTAAALGGGSTYNTSTGAISAPSYVVGGTTVNNVGGAISNIDARTTQNTTDISSIQNQINNGGLGLVQQDASTRNITVAKGTDGSIVDFTGTAGKRKLTGVAAGTVNASSVDAVNGSQLFGLANSTASAIGGGSTVNPDGSISAPNYVVGGTTVNNVGGAISNIDARTTQNSSDITNLSTAINNGEIGLVQQDASTHNITVAKGTDGSIVDFTGTASVRKLTGVAAGAVNASSVDAVNGSQLFGLANSTASAIGGGSTVNPDGSISAPNYVVGGTTVNNVGGAISNIDARTTQNSSDITNLSTAINNGEIGLVQQDASTHDITVARNTDGSIVDFTGTAGVRKLTGVAAGSVNASSVDAVNGSQLFGLANSTASAIGGGSTVNPDGSISAPSYVVGGTTVNNVGGAISDIDARTTQNTSDIVQNSSDITDLNNRINQLGSDQLVQQDPTTRNITVVKDTDGSIVDFTGTAGQRVLTGVAAGAVNASSFDAVNGSQLFNVAQSTANAFGGGSSANSDGTISAPSYVVGGTTVNNVGGAISNIDARTTQNTTAITDLTDQINNGQVGLVQQDPATQNITVAASTGGSLIDVSGSEGARVITGVANGAVNASSSDAINGSQLYNVSSSMADALGGGSTVNSDGMISAPTYVVGGTTVNNVGNAITNIDARTMQNTADIASINDGLNSGTIGMVQQDQSSRNITVAKDTDGSVVDFSGTSGARKLTGITAGDVSASSTDAVNGAQAYAMNSSIANAIGGGSTVNSDGTISAPTFAVGGTTVNSVGDAVTNLDSRVTQNTSDIENIGNTLNSITTGNAGIKYFHSNSELADSQATGANAVAIGGNAQASADNSVALGANSVADRANTVSVGSKGSERQISNVAAGTQGTDAVNVDQLNETVANMVGNLPAGTSAKDYTDQRFNSMQNTVNQVAKNAYAGVAAAMAMPNMTPSQPGNTVVAAGAGMYKNGSAVGVGATYRSRNSKWLVNGAVSVTSTGDAGVRAQVGYEF